MCLHFDVNYLPVEVYFLTIGGLFSDLTIFVGVFKVWKLVVIQKVQQTTF